MECDNCESQYLGNVSESGCANAEHTCLLDRERGNPQNGEIAEFSAKILFGHRLVLQMTESKFVD